MENGRVENGVCSSESADGSCDVWSCRNYDSSSADHLVIMVHGIMGSAMDWKFAAEQFVERLPDKVFVHCSKRNMSRLTLDGVDVMGERLANEVLEVIQKRPDLCKISFIAHSMGGLAARYAIGRLYRPPVEEMKEDSLTHSSKKDSRGTIAGLEAVNFITVATPHLGSRGNKQRNLEKPRLLDSSTQCENFISFSASANPVPINAVPFLFGVTALEKVATYVIHWIFRRTGRHLFLVDDDEGKPPLLKRMVEDYGELRFMSALRAFKRRVLYSNVGYDHMVGWKTSSIRRDSELPKWGEPLSNKYPHIVHEEHCTAWDAVHFESALTDDDGSQEIEEDLVKGLSRVSWEKVDVSFHSSWKRYAAHSVIQVKDEVMHMEGSDVIQHLIDHFLT